MDQQATPAANPASNWSQVQPALTGGTAISTLKECDRQRKQIYVGAILQWVSSVVDFFIILTPFAFIGLVPFPLSIVGVPVAIVGPFVVPGAMLHRFGFTPGIWITGGRVMSMRGVNCARVGVVRGSLRYFLEVLTLAIVIAVGVTVPFSTIILLWVCRYVHPADRLLKTRVVRAGLAANLFTQPPTETPQPLTVVAS